MIMERPPNDFRTEGVEEAGAIKSSKAHLQTTAQGGGGEGVRAAMNG